MTNAFILDLKDVNNEQASLNTVDVLVQALTDDKTAHKEIMKDFYSKCLSNLESESSEPKLKFYTVMVQFLSFRCSKSLPLKKNSH